MTLQTTTEITHPVRFSLWLVDSHKGYNLLRAVVKNNVVICPVRSKVSVFCV